MKTKFLENFDLCHPKLDRSETLLNLTTNIFSSEIDSHERLKSDSTKLSALSTSPLAAYGKISCNQQPLIFENITNELLSTDHQQELNKKRTRETGKHSYL